MRLLFNILTLLFLFSSLVQVDAQQLCGTPQDDAFMERLVKNKKDWDKTLAKGRASRFAPVTFHLVADNDGLTRLSEELVYKTVCTLNSRYEELGVDIVLYVKEIREINNSIINNDPSNSPLASFKDPRGLNVFCVNDINDGSVAGFYQPGLDYVVMRNDNMGNLGWTMEHEIGHFFSLGHTHRGWEDAPWSPDDYDEKITAVTISSQQVNQAARIELVDRSNCEIAGDFICDTQADYGRGQSCNCCTLFDVILDRNCDTLRPMMNNIMSYSGGCDEWLFSADQMTAMQTDYDSADRLYLRLGGVTEYTPIESATEHLYPINLERVEVYDNVTLEWAPVENAEFYKVYVEDEEIVTTETSLTLNDLRPNALVEWRAIAYNKFGSGCNADMGQAFFTGSSETSAVTDLDYIDNINIFPNPLAVNEPLMIKFESSKRFQAQCKVYNIAGKLVYEQIGITFVAGNNLYEVSTNGFNKGIYIVELTTSEGSITEKIIVE